MIVNMKRNVSFKSLQANGNKPISFVLYFRLQYEISQFRSNRADNFDNE